MANEVQATFTLSIRKMDPDGSTVLVSEAFQGNVVDDMAGAFGPLPGALVAGVMGSGGTPVSLAGIDVPGWAWVEHLGREDGTASEEDDHVALGIHDPEDEKFWLMLELRPGMKLPLPLSRYLSQSADMTGPGTGTAGGGSTARLMLVAYPVPQKIAFKAYER